jgi:exodeoxyribonuclease-3
MKVVSYNLFEGAGATKSELAEFINGEQPDIVCLQEANGWGDDEQGRNKEFASEVDLPFYVYGDSNTRFKLATFSRTPFVGSEVHKNGFWHSAIKASVQHSGDTIDVWNVHLDPRSEANRLDEASVLASMVSKAKKAIAVGDFNSLSATDDYAPDLIEQLRSKGIRKFGEIALRYDVMDYFVAQGLVDVAQALGTNEWTVPTPANTDAHHADRLRLDYMLATQDLASSITSMATVKNKLTDKISDHYPLVVTIE